MKLIRNAFAASIAVAAIAVAACSSHGSSGSGGTGSNTNPGNVGSLGGNVGNTGTVGARLTLATGVSLTSLNWTISNGTNTYTGTVNIGDAQSVEWVAGGILAGSGYTLTVSGSDSQGDPCAGTTGATINVLAGATSQAIIAVTCTIPPDASTAADVHTGSVEVDASVTLVGTPPVPCPGISSFSINPAEIVLGQTAQLNIVTIGPSANITWSVSGVSPASAGGSFSPSNSVANPTFACSQGNSQVLVTATVALPADAGGALCAGQPFQTISALVNCEGSGIVCIAPNPNACGPDGGQVCTNTQTDINNCGTCGHVCPSGAGTTTCTAGVCGIVTALPTACITAPCAASGTNSVRCQASANGVCTPTEAVIVAHDILKNGQGPGVNTNGSCYTCLIANACLDGSGTGVPPAGNNSGTPVTNSECGDPNGAGVNFPFDNPNASTSNPANCLSALTCVITSNGANPASECSLSQAPPSVSNCYCGANTGSLCLSSPASAIGVCASIIDTDIGSTDPTTVLSNFTNTTFSPGGVGLAILNCGLTAPATPPAAAKCPSCFN
jgi:hypothetical protein